MSTTSFTTRLDSDLKHSLEQIAKYEDRSASWVANQAIKAFVDERKATHELLELGLKLADQQAPSISEDRIDAWLNTEEDAPLPVAK